MQKRKVIKGISSLNYNNKINYKKKSGVIACSKPPKKFCDSLKKIKKIKNQSRKI